jgi:ATP/maltotriose-dependent transcriptional regulator MalT
LRAQGDIQAANRAVELALTEHERLPMPFERARTQLLAGQLQRRQRQKDQAATTLREALKTFEDRNTRLWADRARAELAGADVGTRRMSSLSPSEQRVAELAASGMTNRDVAAALFISPKTVESNLAGFTASWASTHVPNSEGTWVIPSSSSTQGLRTQS